METAAFHSLMRAYLKAERRGLTECIVLKIRTDRTDYTLAGQAIMEKLRQTDYIGTLEDGGLYVLLPNTNSEDARFVRERLADIGYESDIMEGGVEWQMK